MTTERDAPAPAAHTPAPEAEKARLDDASLEQVNGGFAEIIAEAGARISHAIDKGDWRALGDPIGSLGNSKKK